MNKLRIRRSMSFEAAFTRHSVRQDTMNEAFQRINNECAVFPRLRIGEVQHAGTTLMLMDMMYRQIDAKERNGT